MCRPSLWFVASAATLATGVAGQEPALLVDGGIEFPDGTVQATAGVGAPAAVEDTGQQTCVDPVGAPIGCFFTGQDGWFQAGVAWPTPRFVTPDYDGTVTDTLTGLVWLQDMNCFGAGTWNEALGDILLLSAGLTACQNYTAGSFDDWRLPNIKELLSLIDYGASLAHLPEGHPFVNPPAYLDYWSATSDVAAPAEAWARLHSGRGLSYPKSSTGFYVWPVRAGTEDPRGAAEAALVLGDGGIRFPDGSIQLSATTGGRAPVEATGQTDCWDAAGDPVDCHFTGQDGEFQTGVEWPDPRFTDNGDGTVTDKLTGLHWLQDADCFGDLPWYEGLGAIFALSLGLETCTNYTPGAFADWRLPNVKELLSLLDYGRSPHLPSGHPFVDVRESAYWSSTYSPYSPLYRKTVDFLEGQDGEFPYHQGCYVWPVRGGQ